MNHNESNRKKFWSWLIQLQKKNNLSKDERRKVEQSTIINKNYVSKCTTFAEVRNIPREKVTDEIVIEVKEEEAK